MRNQVPDPPSPTLVSFAHPLSAARRAAYEQFFQCPVQDNDSHIRVRFPLSYLQIRMPHADPGLKALLDRQAEALLRALPGSDDFGGSIGGMRVVFSVPPGFRRRCGNLPGAVICPSHGKPLHKPPQSWLLFPDK